MVRGHRQLFEGNFSKGGDFSQGRVSLNMGGHVYMRLSSERLPIVKVSSGVIWTCHALVPPHVLV